MIPDRVLNVLLVDNRPENLVALGAILEGLPARLVPARSGAEALRWVSAEDFAVILLDVQMPAMDGIETARRIRQAGRSRQTPIIFLTAESPADERIAAAYSIGAVDFLIKPIVPEILRAKVRVFLELAGARERLKEEIAEREAAEEAVRRLNADLTRRAVMLAVANQELEAFSYSVSHDLRAPLRHIGGFAELLRQCLGGNLDEQARRYLRIIAESTQQMGRLIDDLLTFSRMNRVELHEAQVSLDQLVDGCLGQLEPDVQQRNILWKRRALPEVRGDPGLLRQVFFNLLSNAIKYTRGRDPAIIEIGAAATPDGEWVVSVRDNGAGFDMRYADRLFGVFQRLHRADEFEGTGIGLANVRRIIGRHGGRTWAEGKVGEGATFYFTLPVSPSGGERASLAPAREPGSAENVFTA